MNKPNDKLITFREVYALIGSTCKTAHSARALAKAGRIKAIHVNRRTIRYSQQSVLDLVAGNNPPPVLPAQKVPPHSQYGAILP